MYQLSLDAVPAPGTVTTLGCLVCKQPSGKPKSLSPYWAVTAEGAPQFWYFCWDCKGNYCPGPMGSGSQVAHERTNNFVKGKTFKGKISDRAAPVCLHPDCVDQSQKVHGLLRRWATDPFSDDSRAKLAVVREFLDKCGMPSHSLPRVRFEYLVQMYTMYAELRQVDLDAQAAYQAAQEAAQEAKKVARKAAEADGSDLLTRVLAGFDVDGEL